MNYWPLPGPIIEAGNGMMLVLFGAMLVSAFSYFMREVRRLGWRPMRIYAESKASWAVTILFFGIFVRVGDIWLIRHIENHGGHPSEGLGVVAQAVLIASSIPIVWGSICWMRSVLPLRCGAWAWAVIAVGAIVFGVYMAT